ncbi:MAG: tyrosine/phenylalanine carboxypeptidase domain-containing protein [Sandaracinaceae bacterium]
MSAQRAKDVAESLRETDAQLKRIADIARLLPALTAENAAQERLRLTLELARGRTPTPKWSRSKRRVEPATFRRLETARARIEGHPARTIYEPRLEELELELRMIEALGDARRIRPLAARRFGTGRTQIELRRGGPPLPPGLRFAAGASTTLGDLARAIMASLSHEEEPRVVPALAPPGQRSLYQIMAYAARRAGLDVDVRVEPRLSAGAATGDRTIFIADRRFGRRECLRFAVHEVLGHAVAAANARSQPIRIYEVGTAGSFATQEGMCLALEEAAGVLDSYRLRIIAARVLATDRMHDGARFGETARWLKDEHGFSPEDAIGVVERAYRGGGVARDAGYLAGWLAVREALATNETSFDALRMGRVGLTVAKRAPELLTMGLARPSRYRPSLAPSLFATAGGTSFETSPPSVAASFTMLEET